MYLFFNIPNYLLDQMRAVVLLLSAEWQSKVAVTRGENAARAAGIAPGSTTLLEPNRVRMKKSSFC